MKMRSVPSPPLLRVLPGCLCQLSKVGGWGRILLRLLIYITLPARLSNEPLLDSAAQGNPLTLVEPCKYSWEHWLAWDGDPVLALVLPLSMPCPVLSLSNANPTCDWWVCRGSWGTCRMQQGPEERQKGRMKLLLLSRSGKKARKAGRLFHWERRLAKLAFFTLF